MRVLLWTEYWAPYIGGCERFAANLVAGLEGRGHQFSIVCDRIDRNANSESDPRVHAFPIREALANRDIEAIVAIHRDLAELMRRYDPDLIHVIAFGPGDLFLLKLLGPVGCLVTMHQYVPAELLGASALSGRILRAAQSIVACSAAVASDLLDYVPEARERLSVIHNAAPTSNATPSFPSFSPARVLCLGRLVEDKGFDVALEAFARVLPRAPQTQLVIAGDGPERQRLERLATDRGIVRNVIFTGWIHPRETASLMESAAMVLMPSRREPFGLVALECALAGRPIVASRTGGLSEVVEDGETGILVDADDVAQTAEALISLLDDPRSATAMGQRTRQRALERFPFERHIDSYDQLYRRLRRS